MVDILLKANPEAAQCEHEDLVHSVCEYTKCDLLKGSISLFLVINRDVLKKKAGDAGDSNGCISLHKAAIKNTLSSMEYLLTVYP